MTCKLCSEHLDNIVKQAAIIKTLRDAVERSGLDTTMCSYCGEMLFVLPDGGNICGKCIEECEK